MTVSHALAARPPDRVRDDDREQVMGAHRAAEALFTPKPGVSDQSGSDPAQSARARKPRVLPVLPPATIRQETVDMPGALEEPTGPEIPAKKLARLRTLMRYGMTVSQVACLYGVPVEAIERMLQKA